MSGRVLIAIFYIFKVLVLGPLLSAMLNSDFNRLSIASLNSIETHDLNPSLNTAVENAMKDTYAGMLGDLISRPKSPRTRVLPATSPQLARTTKTLGANSSHPPTPPQARSPTPDSRSAGHDRERKSGERDESAPAHSRNGPSRAVAVTDRTITDRHGPPDCDGRYGLQSSESSRIPSRRSPVAAKTRSAQGPSQGPHGPPTAADDGAEMIGWVLRWMIGLFGHGSESVDASHHALTADSESVPWDANSAGWDSRCNLARAIPGCNSKIRIAHRHVSAGIFASPKDETCLCYSAMSGLMKQACLHTLMTVSCICF